MPRRLEALNRSVMRPTLIAGVIAFCPVTMRESLHPENNPHRQNINCC